MTRRSRRSSQSPAPTTGSDATHDVTHENQFARTLDDVCAKLVNRLQASNHPGNVEGLFACYVLGDPVSTEFTWEVGLGEEWLAANRDRFTHAHVVAALGYALGLGAGEHTDAARSAFEEGLQRLRQRDPFPADGLSFAREPIQLLGIALGAKTLANAAPALAWLESIVNNERSASASEASNLVRSFVKYTVTGQSTGIDDLRAYRTAIECAAIEWGIEKGALRLTDPRHDVRALQIRILAECPYTRLDEVTSWRAALLMAGLKSALVKSAEQVVLSREHLIAVLQRFEPAMRRWRWDGASVQHPIHWPITAEREVQDILWLILRSVFEDVVDEDTLPKLGHSAYRPDFGIPSLRVLVEVKYARSAGDFKSIEKEVLEDSVAYLSNSRPRYDGIVVFIYDASASVQEHDLTVVALRKVPNIIDVIVVSRPSQLGSSD